MIRYALRCPDGHEFEGWFRSSQVFDTLRGSGQVTCPDCGDGRVEKAPMAPALAADRSAGAAQAQPAASAPADAGTTASGSAAGQPPALPGGPTGPRDAPQIARALAELRAQVEASSDYVGVRFVQEARAMHDGRAEPRPIHGEARIEDARRMIADGLPVMPLPFRPRRRMN